MRRILERSEIAIDLGTSKIAAFVRGEGLAFEEPACIAFKGTPYNQGPVVAVGTEAARMRERTPQGLFVVSPIRDGVITDSVTTGVLLKELLAKHRIPTRLPKRRFLVGTLLGASDIERRSFEHVARFAGAKEVVLVAEPFAAAIGVGLPIDEPRANMIVDIGGGATEAVVVSLKRVVSGGSVRFGGDAMDEAIIQELHKWFSLDIGKQEARRIKEIVSGLVDPNSSVEVRGVDVRQHRPRAAIVPVGRIFGALARTIGIITDMVKRVIEHLPPELAADLSDAGITLTGGGASIVGLQKSIEEATGIQIKALDTPQQAMIQGCGHMLQYYRHIAAT
ncbi:MAG: rod shape-determining protein MreB [Oligoflexales bacterium]